MYKTNPYNGKKYKKKKVYSPIKDPYIISDKLATKKNIRGIDIFMELFHVDQNSWMIFFRDILKGYQTSASEDVTRRLENIIFLTPDEGLQKQIYSELMDIKDYNPNTDYIPVEEMSPELQTYITRTQNIIAENFLYCILTEHIFDKDDIRCKLTFSFNERCKEINFKENYDVVIYMHNNYINIISNLHAFKNEQEYRVILNDVYEVLKNLYKTKKHDRNHLEVDIPTDNEEAFEELINIITEKIQLLKVENK